jgi:hypothetical protein
MRFLSAPFLENTNLIFLYPFSLAIAAGVAVFFTAVQFLYCRNIRSIWLRLVPLWLALCIAGVSLMCIMRGFHPHEMGFILFCSIPCLLGSLAGLVLGDKWKKK